MMSAFFALLFVSTCSKLVSTASINQLDYESTEEIEQQTDCACGDMEYRPFCGSDLNTYVHLCDINCAMAREPGLHAICSGPCPCDLTEENESNQVFNSFKLQVAAKDEKLLKKVIIKPHKPQVQGCTCPRLIVPVCGSNNITYLNECLLNCDKQIDQNLEKVSNGECKNLEQLNSTSASTLASLPESSMSV